MLNNLDRTTMSFSPLSEEQVGKLHLATIDILERTGMSVQEEEARSLLLDAGAWPGPGDRVRIPGWMVEQALVMAPEKVVLHSQDGRRIMPLERDRCFFGTGSDTPHTIDPYTRKRRLAVKDDTRKFALLCDALDEIDFVMSMGIPSDVSESTSFIHEFEAMVNGTGKPIVFTAFDNRDMESIYEMAVVIAGSEQALRERPFLLLYSEPISPLQHTKIGTEKLLFCAAKGIPCVYVAGTMAGGTAPVTLAGAITQANAECLSGLVISQLKAPGAPFVYGAGITVLDMRTALCCYGDPEGCLCDSIFAAMAQHYGLPSWGMAGATDAKTLDAQAAAEATHKILMSLLAGNNLTHDIGYIDNGLTSCMEMVLFGDEIISLCRRLTRGVELDEIALAADAIDEVGPGGHYLTCDHTLDNFRTAHWFPRFMDRQNYETWEKNGSHDMHDRLNAGVRKILEEHEPRLIAEKKREEIARIVATRALA